ncbi:MAG: primosomal protein N' [Bacteroidales bacterium]|nr:primosomal protein N' [Bacteroidales bacterium]
MHLFCKKINYIYDLNNNKTTYTEIILPVPLPKLYTYSVPDDINADELRGKRVIVQFGKKKHYTGIVKNVTSQKPGYETKEIISVLDEKPIISDIQFQLWDWTADYYMCTLGDVFRAALPSGLKLESQTNIILIPETDYSDISEKEELIIGLLTNEDFLPISKIEKETDFNVLPVIKKLVDKEIVKAEEWIKKKYKPKYDDYISLPDELKNEIYLTEILDKLNRAKKQSELLMSFIYMIKYGSDRYGGLKPANEFLKKDLLKHSGASQANLKALIDKGYLKLQKKEVSRFPESEYKIEENNELNEHQKKALSEIKKGFLEKDTVLLHGITSSGKTEIYIELIKEQLNKGKQVLYLLPEIALTAQITTRLSKIFGDKLGVYHSKFNDNERVEVWKSLQNKKYEIILGVRSSVFLPFENLGIIIVDEEHENTYKQFNPAPRYNARDVSIVAAKIHGAKVLLGTATPSIESYFNAKTGKYGLVELFIRYKDISLPEIEVADIKEARHRKQMKSLFAPTMLAAIKHALENKEQIILFQNRRGFSPFTECETCGYIPRCENCDVSLTYHKYTNQLVCHYCGYSERASKICKACESPAMATRGFGTQKIEDEIKEFFPEVKVARMDTDSTGSKKAYQKIICEFETGKTNVLIGTQMVSKGLDFDNVALVGIMNADNMLNFPDFRAFERAYQLMAQVSGRAGRKNKQGKVIIQTSDKIHPIIKNVIDNNYSAMFISQSEIRKQYKYPPFYRLIQLNIKHKQKHIVDEASEQLARELRAIFGKRILGPEFPVISWIKTWYIKVILIKLEKKVSHKKAKELINITINNVKSNDKFKYVQFVADVDPM